MINEIGSQQRLTKYENGQNKKGQMLILKIINS